MKTKLLSISIFLFSFQYSFAAPPRNPQKIFQQLCSGCHGQTIEAFVDRNWLHGKTKPEIIKSITVGYPDASMPAWKEALTAAEIKNMATYIEKSIKNVDSYSFSKPKSNGFFESGTQKFKIDTIATDMNIPWGLTQLPTGDIIVTSKNGKLHRIDANKQKFEIKNVPAVVDKGQAGLLDVEIHPNYAENGWIYLTYTKQNPAVENETTTALIRAQIDHDALVNIQELFLAKPYVKSSHHNGSRIVFDGKDHVFFSVGERGKHFEYAQKTDNDLGKVHRLYDDGRIPEDNPKVNEAHPSIWSWGHRNPQGLYYDASNDKIFEHEHGPRGGDELNLLKPGANYGWPAISYGINYDGKPITGLTQQEGMEQPQHYYIPSIAPSGLAKVTSDKYPGWKGSLLIGSLRFNYLERVEIKKDGTYLSHKELMNIGRMRAVKMGFDGYLYLGLENPGMVVRVMPVSAL